MRIQQFLESLTMANWMRTYDLASGVFNIGGWEGWLQTEWSMSLMATNASNKIEREYAYPKRRQRCDFYASHNNKTGIKDETYIELKCINYKMEDPEETAFWGFIDDVKKVRNNLSTGNGIAVMVNNCTPEIVAKNLIILNTNGVLGMGIPIGEVIVVPFTSGGIQDMAYLGNHMVDNTSGTYIFLYNPEPITNS